MRTSPIVLDASVAMKLVIAEERSLEAQTLILDQNDAALPIVVPPHFHGEVSNALHQQVRRSALQVPEALEALDEILGMEFEVLSFEGISHEALEFASQHLLASVYDALYLVLASHFDADFWTDDQRLLRTLGDDFSNAHWIGDYEPA